MDALLVAAQGLGSIGGAMLLIIAYEKFRKPRIVPPAPAPPIPNNLGAGNHICKEFREMRDAMKDLTEEVKKQGKTIARLEGIIAGQGRVSL